MKIRVVKTLSEFKNLKSTWDSLLVDADLSHINSSYEWNWIWWKIYGTNKKLYILVVSENNEVIGIAPLCLEKSKNTLDTLFNINRLSFIGSGISDSLDFIIVSNNKKVVLNIFDFIEKNCNCDEVRLMDINRCSINFKQFLQTNKLGKFKLSSNKLYGTYSVQIKETFDNFLKKLSKDQKRTFRKRFLKLQRNHKITFEVSNSIDDEFLREFNRLEVERSKIKKHQKRNILLSKHFLKFVKELNTTLPRGSIKIFKILYESKIIAYNIIFDFEKKLYAWLTSYDIKFSEYSIGILVQKYALEFAFNNNYEMFDFMRGDETYKKFFSEIRTDNYSFLLYRQNIKMSIRSTLLNVIKILQTHVDKI